MSLFIDAAWTEQNKGCDIGFILVSDKKIVIFPGANDIIVESSIQVEVIALEETVRRCLERKLYPQHIYTDCTSLVYMIYQEHLTFA